MYSRRTFMKGITTLVAVAAMASSFLLTGCHDQSTLALLIGEMSTAWQALETALGKTLPASIVKLFSDAQSAVQGWIPGTPVQSTVEALQALVTALTGIQAVIPGMTALEAAAATVVLNTVINIIEDIDPGAVPPSVNAAVAKLAARASVPVTQKHIRKGALRASALRSQFSLQWTAVTGRTVN